MASGTLLDFVPARNPEAVRMDVSKYKIIKPKDSSSAVSRKLSADQNVHSSSDGESDNSAEAGSEVSDSDDAGYSDSMEDSEKSDTDEDDKNTSSSDDDHDESGNDPVDNTGASDSDGESEQENKPAQAPQNASTTKESSANAMIRKFYDINENQSDRGTRDPKRIHKSWHPSMRAPVGLLNRGVTCYMNAAIQTILHLPAIGRYLLEVLQGHHPKVSKDSVTYEFAALFKKMMEKKSPVFPMRMLRRLEDINPMLDEWNQEDSHEYFMSLVSRLQEDSVPRGEKLRSSIMHDIFGGSVEQKVTCQRCLTVSTTSQDFYDLPVSFSQKESESKYTLEQSIRDFFTPETISAAEKGTGYQCEKCKKRTKAVKQIAIFEAPEYLTVHIKRFKMDGNVSKKVKETIKYPLEMNLTEYETKEQQDQSLQYKLIGVIVHEGRTVSSGHYIALSRQPNGSWMMYDDELTRPVPESYVESHPSAYILVYSRLLERPRSKTASISTPATTKPEPVGKPPAPTNELSPKRKHKSHKLALDKRAKLKLSKKLKSKSHLEALAKSKSKSLKLKPSSKSATTKNGDAHSKRRVSAEEIDDIFGASKKRKTHSSSK